LLSENKFKPIEPGAGQMTIRLKTMLAAAPAFLLAGAAPAWAHVGHVEHSSFVSGLLHPLTGADHLLAMVAVGVWAAMIGGRALYTFPAAFVGLMVLSALAGMGIFGFGGELPLMEAGIALSVVALGLAVAFNLRAGLALGTTACALFAIFHGYAHGAELPVGAGAMGYIAGFAIATLGLHAVGIGLGVLIGRVSAGWVARGAGGVTAGVGVLLLVG
jgi:urease accessory protein